ncbi:type I restriction endonuclease subunit R [Microbacterium sp. NIBRBAC000506063]|uniref:type I restriction endonuclease subunit R n=1 Tax=Microbacterium sp. NIBRBAC000506063 TaxID=2734618 RepID=UPI001BB5C33B|nr:HsdR family type I site-specific deoxyribonuclease [Microbacterium sp. NIBRBAC000506063]QTV80768.1 type I restriction endonuclease subunit R [Microbacterium sp. NIBRBAC000506063]
MCFKSETEFEKALIKQLQDTGWSSEVLKNPTEKDLLDNWANILLQNNAGRDRLNGVPLTETEMRQIVEQIRELRTPVKLNRFVNGRSVTIRRDNPADPEHLGKEVSLSIYDRLEIAGGSSRYQIAQQPKFATSSAVLGNRRGDLMLLINGMPMFHIELKASGKTVDHATKQLERYAGQGVYTGLFSLVQVMVGMTPDSAVYFANPGPDGSFNKDFFFHWADFNNERIDRWDQVAQGLLSIPMAHQLIGFYTVADESDGVLKVMRSYQLYATKKISDTVAKHDHDEKWDDGVQRGGYIWHTTGSGKTLTSFKSAELIANSGNADKVVFLLDRIELGTQSHEEYQGFADSSDDIQKTEHTNALVAMLKSENVRDTLIVTSIQKMSILAEDWDRRSADIEKISNKRVVFIVDEAHRSTFGTMMAGIKHSFPRALFFGFTGTPIHTENEKKGSTTATLFGDELHRYSIADGIRDRNVLAFDTTMVQTYPSSELRKQVALRKAGAASDTDIFGDPEKEKIYDKFMDPDRVPDAGFLGADGKWVKGIEDYLPTHQYDRAAHREAVVSDIHHGWVSRSRGSKFHAILATNSIAEAIEYYRLFKALHPDLKVTALFDPHADEGDAKIMKEAGVAEILEDYNAAYGQQFTLATHALFKVDVSTRLAHKEAYKRVALDPTQQLDLLIVVSQLLTGFDSKWVNTLYLDKVLRFEEIIQAFSRTNRLFGPEKPFGTIRYYRKPWSMHYNIDRAVELYSGGKPLALFVEHLDRNLEQMNLYFTEISRLFSSAGHADFAKLPADERERAEFAKLFARFNEHLEAAKIQGFVWGELTYSFDNGKVVTLLLDETTYLTLVLRYKELGSGSGGGDREAPFVIETHLTEIDTGRIDSDYLDNRFEKWLKSLEPGSATADERKALLEDIHRQFAHLSQDEQKYAELFLHDVEAGDVELVSGRTFREYVMAYQYSAKSERIKRVADTFGVDAGMLTERIDSGVDEARVNEFGRFDALTAGLDTDAAVAYVANAEGKPVSVYIARIRVSRILRDFIVHGVLPVDLSDAADG